MTFKEWLLLEDIASGEDDPNGDFLYPTDAGDYAYVTNSPQEHQWLQWKWRQEKKQGRKFHNINQPEFDKRTYVSMKSNTMPEAGSGFWKHKPDGAENVEAKKTDDLQAFGYWKNSKTPRILTNPAIIQVTQPLEKIFGDAPSGKFEKLIEGSGFRDYIQETTPEA